MTPEDHELEQALSPLWPWTKGDGFTTCGIPWDRDYLTKRHQADRVGRGYQQCPKCFTINRLAAEVDWSK